MSDLRTLAATRFAYPGHGIFQRGQDGPEARAAHPRAPERSAARMRRLELVCLRTPDARTDGTFRAAILSGDALPEPKRGRRPPAAAAVPRAEAAAAGRRHRREGLAALIRAPAGPARPPVLPFCLANRMARHFVTGRRETIAEAAPLFARHRRPISAFDRGRRPHLTSTAGASRHGTRRMSAWRRHSS